MAPRRKNTGDVNPDTGRTTGADDADDSRAVEHPKADAVRNGELSAAQMGDHAAGESSDYPDAIYPPGHVETAAGARAVKETPA